MAGDNGGPEAATADEARRATGPAWEMAFLLLVVSACGYIVYLTRTDFHVLPREDTIECVVAAEEIKAGHGMTTRVISPSFLTYLHGKGRAEPPWPNAQRSPLPCLMIAWLSRIFFQPMAVALSSGIFFVLSVPLLFLIGWRLSGRAAGLLASAAYAVSPAGLWYGVTGLTESSTIFSLAAVTYLMIPPLTWHGCLLAGVAAGIGYLGRATFKIWAVLIVVYILWRSREAGLGRMVGRCAAFALPLLVAVIWWGSTMGRLTGEFEYSAQEDISIRRDTGLYPGRSSSLALETWKPLRFIMAHKTAMVKKYGRLAERAWPALANMGALPFLICFFLAELFVVATGGKRVQVHWLVYALLLVQLLIAPLSSEGHGGVSDNRYLDPFGPLAAALGAAFAVDLLGRHGVPVRRAVLPAAVIITLTGLPSVGDLAVGPYHQRALAAAWELEDHLATRTRPDDIFASTHAAMTAWRSALHSVDLPITPEDFLRMDREMLSVDWVYLRHRGGDNAARTEAWRPIMSREEELPGFELNHLFADGGVLLRRTPP